MTFTCAFCDHLLSHLSVTSAQLQQAETALGSATARPDRGAVLEVCVARQANLVARRCMTEHIIEAHRKTVLGAGSVKSNIRDRRSDNRKSRRSLAGIRTNYASKS